MEIVRANGNYSDSGSNELILVSRMFYLSLLLYSSEILVSELKYHKGIRKFNCLYRNLLLLNHRIANLDSMSKITSPRDINEIGHATQEKAITPVSISDTIIKDRKEIDSLFNKFEI